MVNYFTLYIPFLPKYKKRRAQKWTRPLGKKRMGHDAGLEIPELTTSNYP